MNQIMLVTILFVHFCMPLVILPQKILLDDKGVAPNVMVLVVRNELGEPI